MSSIFHHAECTLTPGPDAPWTNGTYAVQSFDIELLGNRLIARPKAGLSLSGTEAMERLEVEAGPILAALGVEATRPVRIGSDRVVYVSRDGGQPVALVGASVSMPFDIQGPESQAIFRQRVDWSVRHPKYRDCLDFWADARVVSNPRPLGWNMLERMAMHLTGRGKTMDRRIDDAVTRLGLTRADLPQLMGQQALYVGDRHADHRADTRPAIPHHVRNATQSEIALIMERFEEILAGQR